MTWGSKIMRKNTADPLANHGIFLKPAATKEARGLVIALKALYLDEIKKISISIGISLEALFTYFELTEKPSKEAFDTFKKQVIAINKSTKKIGGLLKKFQDEISSHSAEISSHSALHPDSIPEQMVTTLAQLGNLPIFIRELINDDNGSLKTGKNRSFTVDGGSILLQAVLTNDTHAAEELLKLDDIDPNKGLCTYESAKASKVLPPLCVAIMNNKEAMVDLLLADKRTNVFQGGIYPKSPYDDYPPTQRIRCRRLPLDLALEKGNTHIINALLQKGAGMMRVNCDVSQAIRDGVEFKNVFTMGIHTSRYNIPTRKTRGFEEAITNIEELRNSPHYLRSRMKILCEQYKNSTPDKEHDDGIALCNRIEEALEDTEPLKVGVDFDDMSVGPAPLGTGLEEDSRPINYNP